MSLQHETHLREIGDSVDGDILLALDALPVLHGASLCRQQVVIAGRALVVILAMTQARPQAFADQCFGNVPEKKKNYIPRKKGQWLVKMLFWTLISYFYRLTHCPWSLYSMSSGGNFLELA